MENLGHAGARYSRRDPPRSGQRSGACAENAWRFRARIMKISGVILENPPAKSRLSSHPVDDRERDRSSLQLLPATATGKHHADAADHHDAAGPHWQLMAAGFFHADVSAADADAFAMLFGQRHKERCQAQQQHYQARPEEATHQGLPINSRTRRTMTTRSNPPLG